MYVVKAEFTIALQLVHLMSIGDLCSCAEWPCLVRRTGSIKLFTQSAAELDACKVVPCGLQLHSCCPLSAISVPFRRSTLGLTSNEARD